MFRQTFQLTTKPALRSLTAISQRSFSVSTARMAEGSTGGMRSGGEAQGDAFTKKEKANEDYYVRQKEREKLIALREKIVQQQKHLADLDKHIDELTKDQGGEKN